MVYQQDLGQEQVVDAVIAAQQIVEIEGLDEEPLGPLGHVGRPWDSKDALGLLRAPWGRR